MEFVDNCIDYVEIYVNVKSYHLLARTDCLLSWILPPQAKFKLNFDSVFFISSRTVGLQVIVRDDKDTVLLAMCSKEVVFKVDEIKAMAALRGLYVIMHLGFFALIFEGDSLMVIEVIRSWGSSLTDQNSLITQI